MTLAGITRTARFVADIRKPGVWILTALLLTAGSADASTILNVAGSTEACFGTGCTNFSSPATSPSTYDLTFTGTTFNATTDVTGSATSFLLGTLVRGNTQTPASTTALPFTLEVTFTLPTGITGGQADTFTALITGTSANGGGGPLPVDFDNTWFTFTFTNLLGSGSFDFSVINDPSVNKNNKNNPDGIYGSIRNAVFNPTIVTNPGDEDPPQQTVPEPSTLVLLGTAVATLARRRWKQAR